jgi:anti-sigma factor RsiW
MSCQETELLIHGYLDNELDLAHSLDIERHLAECAVCARSWEEQLRLRDALRTLAPRYTAPDALRRHFERPARRQWWMPMAAAAAVTIAALSIWMLQHRGAGAEQEVASAHIRSLMANHLTDVPSTDQHTVKPWFSGKLDFSPVVKDFADRGFPLTGGRLDYLAGRPVAAIVYQRRKHIINAFTWPSAANRSPRTDARQGYNIVTWTRDGMAWALVSDLNGKELEELVALLRE